MSDSGLLPVEERLWRDESVPKLKTHKAVGCLFAVAKSLESSASLTNDAIEFVKLVQWSQQIESHHFDSVMSDPQAYHFTRTAYDLHRCALTGAELPGVTASYVESLNWPNANEARDRHLRRFGLFAVSMALLGGQSLDILPVNLWSPSSLPGTSWTMNSSVDCQLVGVSASGELRLRACEEDLFVQLNDNTTTPRRPTIVSPMTVSVCPIVAGIRLSPPTFNLPGLGAIASVVPATTDEQFEYAPALESAIAMIRQYDNDTWRLLAGSMRVVAFKSPGMGGVFNTTCSRLPGAAIFTGARHRCLMAEDLIHEFYHNRLFSLEEDGGFFDETSGSQSNEDYYSPWRDDPRPAYGLFHAVYVFERVLNFWMAVYRSDDTADEECRYAGFRVVKLSFQIDIALAQLFRDPNLNELGSDICNSVHQALMRHQDSMERLELEFDNNAMWMDGNGDLATMQNADDGPMSIRGMLVDHIRSFDTYQRSLILSEQSPVAIHGTTRELIAESIAR